jgi:GT2 family glycosyltransferase
MANGDNFTISVSICTRNRAAFLERAVRSVLPQLTPDTELLLVDNASTDDTWAVCRRLAKEDAQVNLHFEPTLGLSASRNTALRAARGHWVLFLDDDAQAEPGWLESYRKFISSPPNLKIAVMGGGVVPCYAAPAPKWYNRKHGRFDCGNKPLRMAGGGLMGCNSAYHREATLGVGGFDEQFGYKGNALIPREETELQDRLIRSGWECWWLPGAVVQHQVMAERLTFKGMARGAFYAGRAAAIHRLKTCVNQRQQFMLRTGRLIAAPFHILINSIQTLSLFAAGEQAAAVGALCRACRAVGLARQMLLPHSPEQTMEQFQIPGKPGSLS